jgi:hypothetical protein
LPPPAVEVSTPRCGVENGVLRFAQNSGSHCLRQWLTFGGTQVASFSAAEAKWAADDLNVAPFPLRGNASRALLSAAEAKRAADDLNVVPFPLRWIQARSFALCAKLREPLPTAMAHLRGNASRVLQRRGGEAGHR